LGRGYGGNAISRIGTVEWSVGKYDYMIYSFVAKEAIHVVITSGIFFCHTIIIFFQCCSRVLVASDLKCVPCVNCCAVMTGNKTGAAISREQRSSPYDISFTFVMANWKISGIAVQLN
jgi:hypothetical protein